MAQRLLKDAGPQQVAGGLVAAFNNHAAPISHAGMTRGAINVEAFLPALEYRLSYRERHCILFPIVDQAGIEIRIRVELAAGHSSIHLRTNRAAIGKKFGFALRNHFRLILHILPATRERDQDSEGSGGHCPAKQRVCRMHWHEFNAPPRRPRLGAATPAGNEFPWRKSVDRRPPGREKTCRTWRRYESWVR